MKVIKIISSNDNFENHLMNLLELANLQYNFLKSKNGEKEIKYVVLNSINERHDILDGHYCFINMDLMDKIDGSLNVQGYNIITYGLGSKNTVTISSLDYSSGFVYCLQRDIVQNGHKIIGSQEIPVNMVIKDVDELYAVMIVITMGLMNDRYMYVLLKNRTFKILN
ncbi:hypothetical protein [Clostridium luticellarii]|uniref:Uncharacterized protein n=1 Tax=Clostridium luticellarii TaxID=1691940 RepID=A0A2T0BBV4_9CLOT|nr:hypothetical protein [Clostridium luticellarii]MCI1944490.1 hypothetical protein [Clostridium luticellarii]MCI1967989.1 hypothetical protein [Clostridium luticellarii]MCI1995072.1 hypothetical protein [Clostridium luticellarii]MCI2039231.1 hypothetical protein [Clostridium luticellarii]PRR81380.1 hypothetical protein CLLU_31580 [Clostridium luticellarii]